MTSTILTWLWLSFWLFCQVSPAHAEGQLKRHIVHSARLAQDYAYFIYEPVSVSTATRLPIIYLFHGADGDGSDWATHANIKSLADRLIHERRIAPALLVMPSAAGCWWIDTPSCNGASLVFQEIEPHVLAHTRSAGPVRRAIVGISAGGFGALHHALHRPGDFAAIAVLSPAIDETTPPATSRARSQRAFHDSNDEFDPAIWRANNYPSTLDDYAAAPVKVPILMTSDDSDEYGIALEAARLHHILRQRDPTGVHLRVGPGNHSWSYWNTQLADALVFVSMHLTAANSGNDAQVLLQPSSVPNMSYGRR